jgi:hypothetical protein
MLVMSSSDKFVSSPGLGIVGKFGLGFKSVFLIARCPRLLSGHLALRVLGGMFPEELGLEESEELEKTLMLLGGNARGGTLVALDLDQEYTGLEHAASVLCRFERLLPYMLAFARQIRACRIVDDERGNWDCRWQPEAVTEMDGGIRLEAGTVCLSSEGDAARLAVVRSRCGGIMFRVTAEGFAELSEDVPAVWSLAPTKSLAHVGVAVNAHFDLDVGRSLLAGDSEANRETAAELARQLGATLCAFHGDLTRDFDGALARLHGAPRPMAADPYDFWDSFWTLVSSASERATGSAGQLFQLCLWGRPGSGLRHFFGSCRAVPSGLTGQYRVLLCASDAKYRCSGALSDATIFAEVSEWPGFGSCFRPGALVSRMVAEGLKRFMDAAELEPVSLSVATERELPSDGCADPDTAGRLGRVLTRALLQRLSKMGSEGRSDLERLQELLGQACFQAVDGSWGLCTELIVGHGEDTRSHEERLRASFAPPERVLNSRYTGFALEFFLACRLQMKANAEQLTDWILSAVDDTCRKAALRYLDEGELARAIQECLAERGIDDTWLRDLSAESVLLNGMDPNTRAVVSGRLRRRSLLNEADSRPKIRLIGDPGAVLHRIVDWWATNRAELTAEYERWVYPEHRPPEVMSDGDGIETDPEIRRGWMTLLLTGAMQTIGHAGAEQNRGFLQLCGNRGWLDTFSQPELRPEAWMGIMHEFLDQQAQDMPFFHWMGQFVSIYQLAHWLAQYVRGFLAMNRLRPGEPFDLTMVTQPRTSPLFQGGTGFDAPPISRTLGIGANFVLRELVRLNLLDRQDDRLWKFCYVPTLRVRRLVAAITGKESLLADTSGRPWERSEDIYRVLHDFIGDEANFGFAFDIPFIMLSDSRYSGIKTKMLGDAIAAQLKIIEGNVDSEE